ncbi:SulP family inorganic anion transporter [Polynucleobacter sp. IMCC 29146]|uniref:SulP family inorganic anion transporter n=1 Tax=Polynucleobacter sp. IMCC 29146 TaxID=2780953 RepID=UPI001F28C416|nr:SulP family inorganic anion transporter [Polynucleobacter sp. IMCC 29146]MCE7529038.1 SulP family inorganic anion transporter [Polynucleobacter sp. IMCC 29146]
MPQLPFSRWLPEYKTPGTIRADLLAGLTGAVVVLPQGIAFAMLAGMPPQYGLYAAMVPCLIAALFGSSRLMVTGPANAISLTTMALMTPLATPESAEYVGLVLTLSFLIGLIQITLGFGGVGKWVEKVPHSVIVGFTVGAAILIMNSQIGTVTGFAIPRGISPHETLHELYLALMQNPWHPAVLGLVIATILIIIVWRPLNRWFPGMLVAVIIGSLIALYIESLYPELAPFKRVSSIPGAFPAISFPQLEMNTLNQLFGPTLIMALLASTEAMAIARAIALKTKDTFNANQEFIGQGLANIAGSFFSAYPASGSFNRTGVNLSAGAKTPLSAISAALFLMVILAFVGPLAKYLPYPVIGALLLVVAWNLIDPKEIRKEFRHGAKEWLPMVITFIGTITISLEWAILAGIFTSLLSHHLFKAKTHPK